MNTICTATLFALVCHLGLETENNKKPQGLPATVIGTIEHNEHSSLNRYSHPGITFASSVNCQGIRWEINLPIKEHSIGELIKIWGQKGTRINLIGVISVSKPRRQGDSWHYSIKVSKYELLE